MRVNIYAEEMTDRVEIIEKRTGNGVFTGLRIYLELISGQAEPVNVQGPFLHRRNDDSAAVTFWGKKDFRETLRKALSQLDAYYDNGRHLAKQE